MSKHVAIEAPAEWPDSVRRRGGATARPVVQDRIGAIDALRGVAVSLVVIQHALETIWRAQPADPLVRALLGVLMFDTVNLGRLGVMLFFLVSGFVIPASLDRRTGLARFAITRWFRLYPLYWVSIGGALLLAALGEGGPFAPLQILANLSMIQHGLGQPDMAGVYWTLFFELGFYAACAVLFRLRLLHRPIALAGCAGALLLLAVLPATLRFAAGSAMPSPVEPVFLSYMFTGAVLRMGLLEGRGDARRLGWALLALQLLGAPIVSGMLAPVTSNRNGFLPPAALLGGYWAALLIFAATVTRRRGAPGPLRWIGRISYSIYLNQTLTLGLAMLIVPPGAGGIGEIVFLVAGIGATLLLSVATYRWIEQPCLAIGRRLTRRAADAGASLQTATIAC